MKRDPDRLGQRALGRALLARQLLLDRRSLSPAAAIEHLIGLQAQVPTDPYLGLWSRLVDFTPASLERLFTARKVVRIALMRSTIHLVTGRDALALRPLVQPILDVELFVGARRKQLAGLDLDPVVAAGRAILDEAPRTPRDLGRLLAARWEGRDPQALAYVLRNRAPLVQVPPRGLWSRSGQTTHATAEDWLGSPVDPAPSVDRMVMRYLAAFGPASARDVEAWSGLRRLGEVIERLAPRLRRFTDERGRDLRDLPRAPRPAEDVPAPVRYLPSYDNALLGHADRSRIVTDENRRAVMSANGVGSAPVLVDGTMRAAWKLERGEGSALLRVQALGPVSSAEGREVEAEGQRLLHFLAPEVDRRDVLLTGAKVKRGGSGARAGAAPSRR
jgi:hypothetical protein